MEEGLQKALVGPSMTICQLPAAERLVGLFWTWVKPGSGRGLYSYSCLMLEPSSASMQWGTSGTPVDEFLWVCFGLR